MASDVHHLPSDALRVSLWQVKAWMESTYNQFHSAFNQTSHLAQEVMYAGELVELAGRRTGITREKNRLERGSLGPTALRT